MLALNKIDALDDATRTEKADALAKAAAELGHREAAQQEEEHRETAALQARDAAGVAVAREAALPDGVPIAGEELLRGLEDAHQAVLHHHE